MFRFRTIKRNNFDQLEKRKTILFIVKKTQLEKAIRFLHKPPAPFQKTKSYISSQKTKNFIFELLQHFKNKTLIKVTPQMCLLHSYIDFIFKM